MDPESSFFTGISIQLAWDQKISSLNCTRKIHTGITDLRGKTRDQYDTLVVDSWNRKCPRLGQRPWGWFYGSGTCRMCRLGARSCHDREPRTYLPKVEYFADLITGFFYYRFNSWVDSSFSVLDRGSDCARSRFPSGDGNLQKGQ